MDLHVDGIELDVHLSSEGETRTHSRYNQRKTFRK